MRLGKDQELEMQNRYYDDQLSQCRKFIESITADKSVLQAEKRHLQDQVEEGQKELKIKEGLILEQTRILQQKEENLAFLRNKLKEMDREIKQKDECLMKD